MTEVRLNNCEKEEKPDRKTETAVRGSSPSEMEYLRDEIAVLTIQLRE